MIAHMLGYKDLGFFSPSAIIFQSTFTISGILTTSLYPLLLREIRKANKSKEHDLFIQSYFDIYSMSGFILAILLYFFSPFILSLFGSEYLNYSHILKLFSITLFFVFCLDGYNKLLISKSLYKNLFYINLLSVLMNIFLNYILIQSYGIFGAAVGTALSMTFSILVFPLFFKNVRYSVKYIFNSYFFILRFFKVILFIKNYRITSI
jgi:O-antigen/teichoic acid export membrane protein